MPTTMKLIAPARAMGRPQAAEVATAFCMGTLRQLRKGTVSEPPPMPKMAEAQPITVPATLRPTLPGTWPAALGCRRSEEHTSELQSRENLVCRLLLEKKKYHTFC